MVIGINLDKLKTTDGIDVAGKRVIVRADLNVPVKDGKVTDATRLERVMPGLKSLADRGAKVIVISHFGRPKGGPQADLSLKPIAEALQGLLGRRVAFGADCVGEAAAATVGSLKNGDIAVLENLRFHSGEEKNDPAFAAELAELGDIFVGDAFSCAHRAHASTEGLTHHLPSYAGPLLMEEIDALRTALEKPKRPTAAVVGGAKVSTKIPVLTNLVAKVDELIIGGGMANTFLQAMGTDGRQVACGDRISRRRRATSWRKPSRRGCEIILPVDAVVAREFKEGAPSLVIDIAKVPADVMILDVGPQSVARVVKVLNECKDASLERPAGRVRDRTIRRGHVRVGARRGGFDEGGQAHVCCGRRRHCRGLECGRRDERLYLCLDSRRSVS